MKMFVALLIVAGFLSNATRTPETTAFYESLARERAATIAFQDGSAPPPEASDEAATTTLNLGQAAPEADPIVPASMSTQTSEDEAPIKSKAAMRAELGPFGAQVVELINMNRANAKLKPVTGYQILTNEAQRFSTVIARLGNVSHRGDDGSNGGQRLLRAGYRWTFWGENLAAGQESAIQLVADWMASPTHRANILHPKAKEIGIGHTFVDGDPAGYFDYYVMETGARTR